MRQGNRTSRAGPGARQKPCGRGRAWTVLVALPPLLSCGGDGPTGQAGLGDIEITVATSGGDLDFDGYVVTLNGSELGPIASDGALSITDVPSGQHVIAFIGVAANCRVMGSNPRPVALARDRVVRLHFQVECSKTGISVLVDQTGADVDEDGFTIIVDGGAGYPIGPGAVYVLGRLDPGTHAVSISDVAPNCAVDGGASRTVTVTAGAVTSLQFAVTCQAVTGTIEITAVTTGEDLDPDGYDAHVDGGAAHVVTANGTTVLTRVAAGSRRVRLEKLTSNCQLFGPAEQTAQVTAGEVTSVTFQVSCARTQVIAFARGPTGRASIAITHADGGGVRHLMRGEDPAWSPDGRSLAFRRIDCSYDYWGFYCSAEGLFVAGVDDSSPAQLTDRDDGPPDWSPDGTKIAFSRWTGSHRRIHVINADGTALKEVAIPNFVGDATDPVWSPDGTRFAFQCITAGLIDICVMNADGSGFQRLMEDSAFDGHPAWRPDGTEIAFTTRGSRVANLRIALIRPDGSGFQEIADGQQPSWSADGTRIVFRGDRNGDEGLMPSLYIVNADGSGIVRLTIGADDQTPAWRR